MKTEFFFDIWFDIMVDECRSLGYNGPIDMETFKINWENGDTPEKAAEDFLKDMID